MYRGQNAGFFTKKRRAPLHYAGGALFWISATRGQRGDDLLHELVRTLSVGSGDAQQVGTVGQCFDGNAGRVGLSLNSCGSYHRTAEVDDRKHGAGFHVALNRSG